MKWIALWAVNFICVRLFCNIHTSAQPFANPTNTGNCYRLCDFSFPGARFSTKTVRDYGITCHFSNLSGCYRNQGAISRGEQQGAMGRTFCPALPLRGDCAGCPHGHVRHGTKVATATRPYKSPSQPGNHLTAPDHQRYTDRKTAAHRPPRAAHRPLSPPMS